MNKNRIIPQMFDVRPVDETGDLDLKKIKTVEERVRLAHKEKAEKQLQKRNFFQEESLRREEEQKRELEKMAEDRRKHQEEYEKMILARRENLEREKRKQVWLKEEFKIEREAKKNAKLIKIKGTKTEDSFSWKDFFVPPKLSIQFNINRNILAFGTVAMAIVVVIGSTIYINKGLDMKGRVLGVSQDGFDNLTEAISEMTHQNFENSSQKFSAAADNFSSGSKELEEMGGSILDATRFIPFASKVSSGRNAIEAGKHFALAGQSANEVVKMILNLKKQMKNPETDEGNISFLDVFKLVEKNISVAKKEMDAARENIDKIVINDLPKDKQDKFLLIKQNLPDVCKTMEMFLNNSHIFVDLLGGNGPRKYLFLFQNNSEMRPTGGFVGSYGLLDISNGHVKKFFIDGIFNPDGQLKEKIVPPTPIQKISAAWSMHDSNWFPDFPTSAEKAILFYEKTGGPTADGVIALTPTIMQKLLEITGPIEMVDYGVTLDANNFVELTQQEVEVDYDKEKNQPKKILSDLAPILLEKLFNNSDLKNVAKIAGVLVDGLNEKQILLYSQNSELQKIISAQKWSGEILPASKDYLSVINTNINGYKTDAVINENINHKAEIQDDGSIINTVIITRKHTGGNSEYDWFNKVNANYMRVYVPEGSKLLEVSGQTREAVEPPLDYDALGFKRDAEVKAEENSIIIDPESGTRIYNDKNKTVFANWVYVSPQEEVTVTYKYQLPFSLFKVNVENKKQQLDTYSLVVQKQSGSLGSYFVSRVTYPENYNLKWNIPDNIQSSNHEFENKTTLTNDYFTGAVFEK